MDATTFLAWLGAITGTCAFVWDIIKWRQDKRPRLNIVLEIKNETVSSGELSDYGTSVMKEDSVIIIHASNPTDRQINVQTIEFLSKGHKPVRVPLNRTISNVPAQEKRHAVVIIQHFKDVLAEQGIKQISGRFRIVDELGYKHKSKSIEL